MIGRAGAIGDAIGDVIDELGAWAAAGPMALTGRADGPPLGPPAGLVRRLLAVADEIGRLTGELGDAVELDPLRLLGERAALSGFERQGTTSCGGATRLLAAADGAWVAISLARPDDWQLLPPLFELDGTVEGGDWDQVGRLVATRAGVDLVERGAQLLGLPIGLLGESTTSAAVSIDRSCAPEPPSPRRRLADLVVVDLSSLWAGPLAGSILAAAGARVVKVESMARPDGGRDGPAPFFDLLNGGKRSVAIALGYGRYDERDGGGRDTLRRLVAAADVVITAARPRALEQLGIGPGSPAPGGRPQVWLSITGHGATGPGGDRVAFGDDAAVAGGLAAFEETDSGWQPRLCADAIADPLAGLVGARAVLRAIDCGRPAVIDVSMAGVAAAMAGPTLPNHRNRNRNNDGNREGNSACELVVAPPSARIPTKRAPGLGADTADVLAELGIS